MADCPSRPVTFRVGAIQPPQAAGDCSPGRKPGVRADTENKPAERAKELARYRLKHPKSIYGRLVRRSKPQQHNCERNGGQSKRQYPPQS